MKNGHTCVQVLLQTSSSGNCMSSLGVFDHKQEVGFWLRLKAGAPLMQQCQHTGACTDPFPKIPEVAGTWGAILGLSTGTSHQASWPWVFIWIWCAGWVSFPHQSYLDLKMQPPSLGASNYFHEIHLTKAPTQYLWSPGINNHEIKISLCSIQISYTGITVLMCTYPIHHQESLCHRPYF